MTVTIEVLNKIFSDFVEFIEEKDKQSFLSFKSSPYMNNASTGENYKYSVYEEARETLRNGRWKPEDIGTGKIQQDVSSAIKVRVNHNYQMVDNNLVNWRQKDNFAKSSKNKNLERLLFDFYKSKISDSQAFAYLLEEKLSYQFIAYLFFIKDAKRFMPISQERFDKIFEQIGISDFKTSGNASWDNYATFNEIIKQVRGFLLTKDSDATLLDAHSFLWILGSQMNEVSHSNIKLQSPIESDAVEIEIQLSEPIPLISEEGDELAFPEGKEIFRLHKRKERSSELIKAAKQKYIQTDPKLSCQICNFSFVDSYGVVGNGFIEAHHLFPISQLTEETETKIDDLALVCSNCHRMIHRRRPWLTLEDLRKLRQ